MSLILVDTDILIDAALLISEAVDCLDALKRRLHSQSAPLHKWN